MFEPLWEKVLEVKLVFIFEHRFITTEIIIVDVVCDWEETHKMVRHVGLAHHLDYGLFGSGGLVFDLSMALGF